MLMPVRNISSSFRGGGKDLQPYRNEILRKAAHLLALIIPAGMYILPKSHLLLILGLASATGVFLDMLRARLSVVNHWIIKFFGPLMRSREKSDPEAKVVFTGATWVLISAFLLVLIFPLHLAAASFAMFLVGDGAAALVGQRFGRIFWGRGNKTLEGSVAFMGAALLVMSIVPGVKFWIGTAGALSSCLAEAMPGPLNDNLRAPLLSAAVMALLEYPF